MATLTVGYAPQPLVVIISPEVALRFQLQQTDGTSPVDWPSGTAARLEFTAYSFTLDVAATVTGALLSWVLTLTDTASIPVGATARIFLDYDDGNGEFLWLSGRTNRQG